MTQRDGYESHAQQLRPEDRDVADWVTVLMQLDDEKLSEILAWLLLERRQCFPNER